MGSLRGLSVVAAVVAVVALAGSPAAATGARVQPDDSGAIDTRVAAAVGQPAVAEAATSQGSEAPGVETGTAQSVHSSAAASQWRARSACRAPNGDGVIVLSNESGAAVSLRLVREADGHTVSADGSVGESRTSVPWTSPQDRWQVVADGEIVATVVIGNQWCVTTEVRVERLTYACDGETPVVVGYEVVPNLEGVELQAQPSRGGQSEIGTEIHFTLGEGSYSTSMVPDSFTVHDGGTFHFGAVVRYDSPTPDCAASAAPGPGDGLDVFAAGDAPLAVESADGVPASGDGSGVDASDSGQGAPAPDASGQQGPAVVPSSTAASWSAGEGGDILPATGFADVALAAVGGVLLVLGLAVLFGSRRIAQAPADGDADHWGGGGLRRGRERRS